MNSERQKTVLVADDHPAMRAGVARLLDQAEGLHVVAQAANGEEAIQLASELRPDVLLLDVDMPGYSGVDVARALRKAGSTVRILAYSAHTMPSFVRGLFDAGAAGYITKDKDLSVLVEAVKAVAAGEERWFIRPQGGGLQDNNLTRREREVLGRLAAGRSNSGIAEDLKLSESTVRNHLSSVYEKLGVESSREAVAWAWKNGIDGA